MNKQAMRRNQHDEDDFSMQKPEPDRTCKKALKDIIKECTYLPALYPLLQHAPEKILRYICAQFAQSLANNPEGKKQFIKEGAFQMI